MRTREASESESRKALDIELWFYILLAISLAIESEENACLWMVLFLTLYER